LEIVRVTVKKPKVISTNDMYMHPVRKTSKGHYMSYFAKTSKLKELQEFYKNLFDEIITDDQVRELNLFTSESKTNGILLRVEYGIPVKELNEHDVSNFIKSIEDCIVSRTKVDDSRNLKVIAEKKIYESEENEWIMRISLSTYKCLLFQEDEIIENQGE